MAATRRRGRSAGHTLFQEQWLPLKIHSSRERYPQTERVCIVEVVDEPLRTERVARARRLVLRGRPALSRDVTRTLILSE